MVIKSQKQVEQELVTATIAETDKITYFGRGGVVRAILRAISGIVSELWNDVIQQTRNSYVDLAQGVELDTLGARRGVYRKGATKSSTIVTFAGTIGTLIPAGTQLKSETNNNIYTTQYDVLIGSKNLQISGVINPSLADSTVVESLITGIGSRTQVNTIKKFVTPITGVTVNNPVATTGGDNAEGYETYRARIKSQITLLNQGVERFYETLAMNANPDIIRAKARRDSTRHNTIHCVKNSGGQFTQTELADIADYVMNNQRSLQPVTCVNVVFLKIIIEATIQLKSGTSISDIIARVSERVSAYLNWNTFEFGGDILYSTILTILIEDEGVYSIDPSTLKLRYTTNDIDYYDAYSNITLNELSLPRLAGITLTDKDTATETIIEIKQRYLTAII